MSKKKFVFLTVHTVSTYSLYVNYIYKPKYLKETTLEKLVFYTYLHNVV